MTNDIVVDKIDLTDSDLSDLISDVGDRAERLEGGHYSVYVEIDSHSEYYEVEK